MLSPWFINGNYDVLLLLREHISVSLCVCEGERVIVCVCEYVCVRFKGLINFLMKVK